MSIYKVLIEGGGETISQALESAVVDEVFFFISPKIIGGRLAKTPVEGTGTAYVKDAIKLEKISIKRFGQDIMLHGKVIK